MGAGGLAGRSAASCCSALPNPPWWSTRPGAALDTSVSPGSRETVRDIRTSGMPETAGSVRKAHQTKLVPSTSPQHPAVAMTQRGHLRWSWRVPPPRAWPPDHHGSGDRHRIRRRTRACWRWATRSRIWRWKSGGAEVWNKRNKARVRWGVHGGPSSGYGMRVTPFIKDCTEALMV